MSFSRPASGGRLANIAAIHLRKQEKEGEK